MPAPPNNGLHPRIVWGREVRRLTSFGLLVARGWVRVRVIAALLVLLALAVPARAEPLQRRWILDHLSADAAVVAGWRSAWTNGQHSGFSLLGGGGEVNLGLEFPGGYAVLAGARVLAGASSAPGGAMAPAATQPTDLSFLEATGQIGGQIGITDWVRIELGASAGRLWRCCTPGLSNDNLSLVAGGFLRFGVDWWPREGLLFHGLSLWLRLDVDGHPHDQTGTLPSLSMSLALSLGIRL